MISRCLLRLHLRHILARRAVQLLPDWKNGFSGSNLLTPATQYDVEPMAATAERLNVLPRLRAIRPGARESRPGYRCGSGVDRQVGDGCYPAAALTKILRAA